MTSFGNRRLPTTGGRWLDLTGLGLVITCGWWLVYGEPFRKELPPLYRDDALLMLARIQAYSTGELLPLLPNVMSRLNAPFQAAWSDYPVEDLVYAPAGILVAMFGLSSGVTIYLLVLQLAAGIAFYASALLLRVRRDYALAGGILFGLAPYAFQRGLAHVNLTVYWHVPLLILILIWCVTPENTKLSDRHGRWLALTTSFIAGMLCPYYLGPFLLLMGLVFVGQLGRREWDGARTTLWVFASASGGLLLQSMDTLLFLVRQGFNAEAVARDYWGLVKFGLYLPDLIFPSAHRSALVQGLAREIYLARVPTELQGESQGAYIGIMSLIGLSWLLVGGTGRLSARRFDAIPPHFWIAMGLLAFAVAGGLNYLFGAFGFLLLRATNRVSIMLAATGLLYLATRLPDTRLGRLPWLLPVLMVCIGGYDQIPRFPEWLQANTVASWSDYRRDQILFANVEERLAPQAMVFQLPVKPYPESHVIREMGDYEHLRPLLHTRQLRFSYGTVKGRGDAEWQSVVAAKSTTEMIADLERFGFAALMINRRAYADQGSSLADELKAAHREVLAQNADFILFRLAPSVHPALPPIVQPARLAFGQGFHAAEQSDHDAWRWARSEASLRIERTYRPPLYPSPDRPIHAVFRALVEPVRPDRNLWMRVGDQAETPILAKGQRQAAVEVALEVDRSGALDIRFHSDRRPVVPESDYRSLSFRLVNPSIEILE